MAITRISGVLFELIEKIGSTSKSAITRIGPEDKPAAGPTCTEYVFGYNQRDSRSACRAASTSTYYHDETSGTLYSDSCGGTEAADGYYANGGGYREYAGGTLSGILGAC